MQFDTSSAASCRLLLIKLEGRRLESCLAGVVLSGTLLTSRVHPFVHPSTPSHIGNICHSRRGRRGRLARHILIRSLLTTLSNLTSHDELLNICALLTPHCLVTDEFRVAVTSMPASYPSVCHALLCVLLCTTRSIHVLPQPSLA